MEKGVIDINQLKINPSNPRSITKKKLEQLKNSLSDFPEMLNLSPVVINKDNIVIGGNMRLKAMMELGLNEVPYVRAENLTPQQEQEFIIKDNITYGDWDFDVLLKDFEVGDLDFFGLDLPKSLTDERKSRDKDENNLKQSFETWANNDVMNIKVFLNSSDYEDMTEKMNVLLVRYNVKTYSDLLALLLNKYFEDNDLIADRR